MGTTRRDARRPFVSAREVADEKKVTAEAVRAAIRAGRIDGFCDPEEAEPGRHRAWFVFVDDLDRWNPQPRKRRKPTGANNRKPRAGAEATEQHTIEGLLAAIADLRDAARAREKALIEATNALASLAAADQASGSAADNLRDVLAQYALPDDLSGV